MEPAPANPVRPPTLAQQWVFLAMIWVFASALLTIEVVQMPVAPARGATSPFGFMTGILILFGQAGWISMDRRRRNLEVGSWRFGACLLGPVVIAIYLLQEYKARALYLIPLMAAVYASVLVVPFIGALVLTLRT